MKELILIDKPFGITSFDVIRRLRRKLGIKKMGHGGTLDPRASGLMLIGVESGTKKLTEYLKLDKEYVAEILVGVRTDSGDLDGAVLEEKKVEEKDMAETFSIEKVSATLNSLIGINILPVSAYSAIKKDGVPFYKKARAAAQCGESIPESELPVREMKVYEAELLEAPVYDADQKQILIKTRFYVASGVYIRSLAEEFGRRFGFPATLQALRRTKIGDFKVEDAEKI